MYLGLRLHHCSLENAPLAHRSELLTDPPIADGINPSYYSFLLIPDRVSRFYLNPEIQEAITSR